MKIALINGSPKAKRSASALLLGDLKSHFSGEAEVTETGMQNAVIAKEKMEELQGMDILVIACPLYVDGIPSHLLSCLMQLENMHWRNTGLHVYAIVNCGFYEGIQAEYALAILENWCRKAGFSWEGGLGVGGGGSLGQLPSVKGGHGPREPVDRALGEMAEKILGQETQENRYVSVAIPRFLYKMAAQIGWRQMIKANGGRAKDLGKRL